MKKHFIFLLFLTFTFTGFSQNLSKLIVVDQFGYLPNSKKIAVLKSPEVGFDASQTYTPGNSIAVVNAKSGEQVFTNPAAEWKSGSTDASSGDKVWHFDFSNFSEIGYYYILDIDNNLRSFEFKISPSVYNELLKHAVRTFYYQRVGFEKEAIYAGKSWADGASHIGELQDYNCRLFSDKDNEETERDVSGGWYDAGDYNKYTSWTCNYVIEMMQAYLENPNAFADDYNIPESGNNIPDLLDEAKWGIDHLLRLQFDNGSVISVIGEDGGSPPSTASGQSLYGPANTSATLKTAGALAISSKVFRSIGKTNFADTLLNAAIAAYNWAEENPNVLFNNNSSEYNSEGLAAGQMEMDDYGRLNAKLQAAVFLFETTENEVYRNFIDTNYTKVHLFEWNFAYPFETTNQNTVVYYANLANSTPEVAENIKNVYKAAMTTGSENLPAINNSKDPYMAHLKDYTWGSNSSKAGIGNMYQVLLEYNIDTTNRDQIVNAAEGYLHYLHGVNPLNFVYLSNMFRYGADNGVRQFYHSWFKHGSSKWDQVGVSTYGPAPGFITGGPNPSYNWDGCCPNGCGSTSNNDRCYDEHIEPPKNQPNQKSYKDFNNSWPLNSWSVTENSGGYQVAYIKLLSKFVNLNYDCNGDMNGTAFTDVCGNCVEGNTGITATTNEDDCEPLVFTSIEKKHQELFRIYPNPGKTNINIETGVENCICNIYDISGKLVKNTCIDYTNTVNIEKLNSGFYNIEIIHNNNVFTESFIKE